MNGIEVLEAQEALSESGRVDVEVVLGGTTFLTLPICLIRRVVPLDGRFEHVVLFCTSTPDHAIIWIDREVKRALDDASRPTTPSTTAGYDVKSWKKTKKITFMLRYNDEGATKLPDDKEGEYKSVKRKAKKGWLLVNDAVGSICTRASNCYFHFERCCLMSCAIFAGEINTRNRTSKKHDVV
ncbi:hypothetical protein HanIR_Chr09g0412031 [Helianthus annuus]|nr:hypothetical protein HanIR_Chr09g0412031 [Helianthus annuus]